MEIMDGAFRRKKVSFSMVPNELIQNETISLRAKGLYALIQSYITREDFTLYKSFLLNKCQEGKKAFESAWKELKIAGYLKPYRMQGDRGHFYYEYELLDIPEPEEKTTEASKPETKEKAPEAPKPETKEKKPEKKAPKAPEAPKPENKAALDPAQEPQKAPVTVEDLKKQVNYGIVEEGQKKDVNALLMLMEEVFNMKPGQKLRINQNEIDCSQVQERFRKIDYFTLQYVLETLAENTTRVRNTRSYMLTALFNAPATHNYYFQNWVNHDMYN